VSRFSSRDAIAKTNLSGVPDLLPKWWSDDLPSRENIHNFPHLESIFLALAGSPSPSNAPWQTNPIITPFFRRFLLLVQRRPIHNQFYWIPWQIIICDQTFLTMAISRNFFQSSDDSKADAKTRPANRKLTMLGCIFIRNSGGGRIDTTGRQRCAA
jgi:hypothetical protein